MSSASSLPIVPGTEPERCILDAFRIAIASQLTRVFPEIPFEKAFEGVDYSKKDSDFTVAMPRFKLGGKGVKPDTFATKFKEEFVADEWVESVQATGAFLTFKCHSKNLAQKVLTQIDDLTNRSASGKPEYGHNDSGKGKKLVLGSYRSLCY
jgi:arginyl-tRNA synthetase